VSSPRREAATPPSPVSILFGKDARVSDETTPGNDHLAALPDGRHLAPA